MANASFPLSETFILELFLRMSMSLPSSSSPSSLTTTTSSSSLLASSLLPSPLIYYYHDFWQDTSHPFTGRLPLVDGGPWKLFSILLVYYMFVRHWGPAYMKDREPFNLKWVMLAHNVFLVALNGICFLIAIPYSKFGLSTWECKPYDHTKPEFKEHLLMAFGYTYYISKFLDLADTIFFVLRKKFRHVSGLHVFHHSVMPFAGWVALKYSAYHCAGFIPFINGFIHTVMYTYYALSALGYQKMLWWKKYLTQMQLVQFVLITIHAVYFMSRNDCDWPKIFPALEFCHGILFFHLFYSFYKKSYVNSSSSCNGKNPETSKYLTDSNHNLNGIGNQNKGQPTTTNDNKVKEN